MISIKPNRRLSAKLDMTPMIDIVFLLLIFFMLTANFMTQEGIKINLPNAKSITPQSEEEITVYINSVGKVYLAGRELNYKNLYGKLHSLIKNSNNKLVVVKSDRNVILDKVVSVMDIAKDAGAEKLSIATEKP